MVVALTVEQAKNKVVQLAISEKDLTSWKDKTKITVKGIISRVSAPRPVSTQERPIPKEKEGRYRDVWLKQERGDNEPAFLKVTVSKNDWRNDVDKLSEKDIGSEQVFTGVASQWEDRASGEMFYSLYGELGDGSRQRSGGGWKSNPRLEIVGVLFEAGMAQFPPLDRTFYEGAVAEIRERMLIVAEAMTPTVVILLALANATQKAESKKPEAKTEEPEETVEDDPFAG